MDEVEKELCGNCKKEIPHNNYVMHTAFCTRNISLCNVCKEPYPKSEIENHKKKCVKPQLVNDNSFKKISITPKSNIEKSSYYEERKAIEDQKIANRLASKMKRMERLVDCGETLGHSSVRKEINKDKAVNGYEDKKVMKEVVQKRINPPMSSKSTLIPCKYCELELPKLDLDEHENYCGARTDKCPECGELVMFKYKDLHQDTNHGFLKLTDEPGPRPSWETPPDLVRNFETSPRRNLSSNSIFRPFNGIENFIPPSYGINSSSSSSSLNSNKQEKLESSKEISRRLDCKTEYIRNLLHDSASITAPIRSTGAVPRNHYNHNKGPAPQPPRRRNPPTELLIPCEFCDIPIPHEDLIQHETGCRPDLTKYKPRRRRSPSPSYRQEDEEELPCEFCSNLIPASQLWSHQETCN